MRYILLLVAFFQFLVISAQSQDSLLKPLKWRCIGPYRGGRSVAASGVLGKPMDYYMGTTGGGLWKTNDMGITWQNISDGFFTTGTIGAIAVAPSDINTIYVGSGEHAIRGVMTHSGDGMYKSTDAGKSWKKIGLDQSQHISRIVIHPKNPDRVFVGVQGALYSKSNQRGIFRSEDGGKTWKNILFVNENTGCAELSIDPSNPSILYAAMWEHGRLPWKIISGGKGSSLYKSTDGGDTWAKLSNGLPSLMGKMSIACSPSNPEKIYALIEAESNKELGGLFLSTDSGLSWSRVTNDHRLIQRAWYYIELFVNPKNDNHLIVQSASMYQTFDGGKSWEEISGTHGDYHDVWFNPDNPSNFAIADDGGVAITFNGGKSWSSQNNMPTSQIYRISVDNVFPYHIYGGQQDNSSVRIPHRTFTGSISETDWSASAGGESAFLAFDPDDPQLVMGGSYQGTIELYRPQTKASTNVMAAPIQYLAMDAKDMKYRYNWNAPIIYSRHQKGVWYHCSQLVLKSTDLGRSWTEASPDLTRNDKTKQGTPGGPLTNEGVGAENYGTIAYIIESPHEAGVIYTGSDDGLVHITHDAGKTWQNITPTGLQECLVNAIEVSPHDKATVYIATTRYKFNDHTPAIYKSKDYGKTWSKITNGINAPHFTRVVREDPILKDLLFAGTENGLYLSYNGGLKWEKFKLNFPNCPVTDLKIHQDDLIASTSGRSIWILDDLHIIRQAKQGETTLKLYQPTNGILATGSSELNSTDQNFKGFNSSAGINPANGIVFYYYLPAKDSIKTLNLVIKDNQGNVVRTFTSDNSSAPTWEGGPKADPRLSLNSGLNRFVWDMRHPTLAGIPDTYYEASFRGHKAIPGKYTVELVGNSITQKASFDVLKNPLYPNNDNDYQHYDVIMKDMESKINAMHTMINDLHEKRASLDALIEKHKSITAFDPLRVKANSLSAAMKQWDEDMVQRLSKAYDDVENFPNKFAANYIYVLNMTESDIPVVNQGSIEQKKILDGQWDVLKQRGMQIINSEVKAFNESLWKAGLGGL